MYTHSSDIANGLLSDQTIMLIGAESLKAYPKKLCRVHYYDKEYRNHLYFLTNIFSLPALLIAKLYKCRWQVKLFFKWIKQNQ
jgi:IS4 transposase